MFGPIDLSIGIGWGQLGRVGNINNPLSSLRDSFKSRGGSYGEGGSFNYKNWFSGEEVGLFGGIESIVITHFPQTRLYM